MQDGDRDGKHRGGDRDRDRGRGPDAAPGTEFLDLEMSKVLYGEAEGLAREAVRDILRGALRERLRERLGSRLEAIAAIAADALADELEANLRIEGIIQEQGGKKKDVEERLRAALATEERPQTPPTGPGKPRDPGPSKARDRSRRS